MKNGSVICPPPSRAGRLVLTRLSVMICKILTLTFLIFYGFYAGNGIKAQAILDCNGDLTCFPASSWTTVENVVYHYEPCDIVVTFRYAKCGDPVSQYAIDIISIRTFQNNPVTQCNWISSSITNEAIKTALAKLNEIENLPFPMPFDISVKTNACYEEIFNPINGEVLTPCSPLCCVTRYTIKKEHWGLTVTDDYPDIDGSLTASCSEPCYQICSQGHPLAPTSIYFNDYYESTLCEIDCFWKLQGNDNVTADDFIGPTNGEDFIIKTKEDQGELTEKMRISAAGNIGIHNQDPLSKLDVIVHPWYDKSRILLDHDGGTNPNNGHGNSAIKLYRPVAGDIYHAYPWWIENSLTGNGSLQFKSTVQNNLDVGEENPYDNPQSQLTNIFTLLRNGNVGIGVDIPAEKLVVDGTVCAKEVRVALSGGPCWPDYVFGEDYKLRELSDLENYIKTNKCLPDIPTAEEVTNSGVELGDMQARMLKKIEELTLYIIELKKENEEIRKIVNNKR